MSYAAFVTKKIDVALQIGAGGCGGGYTEGAMILAALSSGISADIWEGPRIDKKRFVELWAAHADQQLGPLKISVPLLVQSLRKKCDLTNAEKIEAAKPEMFGPGHASRVLIGPEVDMSEAEIISTGINPKNLSVRAFSYPALFYEHVRCGLMHEFHLTEKATWSPMTQRATGVSYSNRGSLSTPHKSVRLIHFHIPWLAAIVRSIVTRFGENGPTKEQLPNPWWIDG